MKLLWWIILVHVHCVQAQTNFGKTIIISEIMADPSPPVALPAVEYLELYNASGDTINLYKWTIRVGNAATTINRTLLLAPDKFVICCAQSQAALFDSSVFIVGLSSFPSIDNEGALVQLIDTSKSIVHAVAYHNSWYRNPVKANGGWSLELIDRSKPCLAAENWKASIDEAGGTPGRYNSVAAEVIDDRPPRLLRAFCNDSLTVIALFDESLDAVSSAQTFSYSISNRTIGFAALTGPLFNTVLLRVSEPLHKGVEYLLEAKGIMDCSGNAIGVFGKVKVGLPEKVSTSAIVINEILFNPASGGSDYVELYNGSNSLFDLQELYLSSRTATNALQSVIACSSTPRLIFPGDHFVFTTDSLYTIQQYLVREPGNLIEVPALPSMPDNAGAVVLLSNDSKIIDEVKYSEKWHFPLLNNPEGVSLERISFKLPSNDPSNWTSAASNAGFGTPTHRNSQFQATIQGTGSFNILPKVFSPDGDGQDDIATIEYNLDRAGMMGSVTVFDLRGRPVRMLVTNTSLAQTGTFRWDGLDMHQRPAAPGMYIVLLDVFNLQGVQKKYKAVVVIAASDQ